ncbi:MAG: MaoC/PaaZ C-terminal domain-containing protein [bacterium]
MNSGDPLNLFSRGEKFTRTLAITSELLERYGRLSGDFNPLHVDDQYARGKGFKSRVVYGNIYGMLLSTLVGMDLGHQEVMLLSERFDFEKPVYIGDTIQLTATVVAISVSVRVIELALEFSNITGESIASGKCQVKCL